MSSTPFRDFRESVGVSKSTLSYDLKKLTGAGIVRVERSEREMVYRVNNPNEVADSLVALQESLESDAVDGFVDIWRKFSR